MKTKLLTILLSLAFLSAGAFADNSHQKPRHLHADAGFSIAYKTQL